MCVSLNVMDLRHLPHTEELVDMCFCPGNTDNLNTPLRLQFSDVLAGPLILSLEHLISKFNRWVG